jgi:CxxC motif-containing protein
LIAVPDIITPIAKYTKNFFQVLWWHFRHGWLWARLLLHRKRPILIYFESIQQDLINEVPAYLCWDAKYFHKVKINDIDVTFDKSPFLIAEKYTGNLKITVYGLFAKTSKTISLKVKSYEQTKKIRGVIPKVKFERTEKFLEIQDKLLQVRTPKIKTKKSEVKIRESKLQKLSLKTEKIIGKKFIEYLIQESTYHNYQQDFLTEKNNQNGE